MIISDVHRDIKKYKKARRVGRGPGSGHGKTSARGHNGQKSRAGWSRHPIFQGGAMPMIRRVPKRGFNNRWALKIAVVNVRDLEAAYESGEEVNPENLSEKHLANVRYDELKILGDGEITKKLKVSAHRFSKSAQAAIEKAGGEVVVLPGRTPVEDKKKESRAAKAKAKKK